MRTRFRAARARAGFSLVDVCVALFVLAIAVGALVSTTFSALRLEQVNESTAAANQALRGALEEMNAVDFESVYAAYNATSSDDPDPNHDYLDELDLSGKLPKGSGGAAPVAQVSFPGDGQGILREDVVDPALGLPRDLNGDGVIDSANHAGDYKILPVTLKLQWDSPSGMQRLQVSTLMRSR